MNKKLTVNPWVLLGALVVIAGSLGFLVWNFTYADKATTTTSPSPTKIATTSPATSTPTSATSQTSNGGGQTAEPTSEPTATDQTNDKTYSGVIESYSGGCPAPTVSFNYPSNYDLSQQKYMAGTGPVNVSGQNPDPGGQYNNSIIEISNGYSAGPITSGNTNGCQVSSASELFNLTKDADGIKNGGIISVSEQYSINGNTAIDWQSNAQTEILGKTSSFIEYGTILVGNNNKFVVITYRNPSDKDAYITIRDTLRFQ